MWQSVEEINKAFDEHIESLEMSGVDFDFDSIEAARRTAIRFFLNIAN